LFRPSTPEAHLPIPQRIRWIAEALGDWQDFSRRASVVAAELGPTAIPSLAAEFHTEFMPPDDLKEKFSGLGAWIAARQFAIFEILYHLGAPAVPLLKTVAFGEYDWTQGNAIEVLCRLAAFGIARDEIISGLKLAMPDIRPEALDYAAGPLVTYAKSDSNIQLVVDELLSVPEFKQAWDYESGSEPGPITPGG
jgi:hypothetical protein